MCVCGGGMSMGEKLLIGNIGGQGICWLNQPDIILAEDRPG